MDELAFKCFKLTGVIAIQVLRQKPPRLRTMFFSSSACTWTFQPSVFQSHSLLTSKALTIRHTINWENRHWKLLESRCRLIQWSSGKIGSLAQTDAENEKCITVYPSLLVKKKKSDSVMQFSRSRQGIMMPRGDVWNWNGHCWSLISSHIH